MRYLLLGLCLLLPLLSFAQDEIEYKEYSYSEFFQMIEDEPSEKFSLKDALIIPDTLTDKAYFTYYQNVEFDKEIEQMPLKDTIVVKKALSLNNVQFFADGPGSGNANPVLSYIHFKSPVSLTNAANFFFASSTFEKRLSLYFDEELIEIVNHSKLQVINFTIILHSKLKEGIYYFMSPFVIKDDLPIVSLFSSCEITTPSNNSSIISNGKHILFSIYGNVFNGGGIVELTNTGGERYTLKDNHFESAYTRIAQNNSSKEVVELVDNHFDHYVGLNLNQSPENSTIYWNQFANKSLSGVKLYTRLKTIADTAHVGIVYTLELLDRYAKQAVFKDQIVYKEEQKLKGYLMNFYKAQNDLEYANMVYVESKDLETNRLGYLYQQEPHFNTFFKWKINQFLKVFSSYGTEPSKAIVFSVYVILAFAIVYLFFPNYWDSHGKNRVMNRYRFFTKYMKQDSGMHEVYLEEKNPELMASEDFKTYMLESEKGIPKFFMATALPLYRWSVAGTKSFSWLLSKVDVLKGKWSDTEDSKKGVKTVLLIGAFLISLTYDIFIKMLNALMLSINTFTTLGFGEIPIKGLPRYLAIIQGFIGWFMLTIFSVSLISQLLN